MSDSRSPTEEHGRRIAVIQNDYGEVGIDGVLAHHAEEEAFEMNHGCICRAVRGDRIRILGTLPRRREWFDRITIEATGLAGPAPVAQSFFVDQELRSPLRPDAIAALVDARHILAHLHDAKPGGAEHEAPEQVACADGTVLNKTPAGRPGVPWVPRANLGHADALRVAWVDMDTLAAARRGRGDALRLEP